MEVRSCDFVNRKASIFAVNLKIDQVSNVLSQSWLVFSLYKVNGHKI